MWDSSLGQIPSMELKTGFSVRGLQITCIFLASEVKLFVGILMQKSDSITENQFFSKRFTNYMFISSIRS